jgi:ABC-2 type transport system permease protein
VTGCLKLARHAARLDIVTSAVWALCLAGLCAAVAAVFPGLFGDAASRSAMIVMTQTPMMISMLGPVYGLENYTTAVMFASEMALFTAVAFGIMNIAFVIRHTRKDEEAGRLETMLSLPVGRLAAPVAALTDALALNILIGALTGIALPVFGGSAFSLNGSMLFGMTMAAAGFCFAGIGVLCAQLSSSGGACSGWAYGALGFFYILRAAGDVKGSDISLLSPLGWVGRINAFAENNWLPVAALFLIGLAFSAIGLFFRSRRDLQEGLLPSRKGRTEAGRALLSAPGLALRLCRPLIIAWPVCLFIVGAMYGSVFGDMEDFVGTNETIKAALNAPGISYAEQFLALLSAIMAITSLFPALFAALKIKGEENKGRLEPVLAAAVPRSSVLLSYACIGAAAPVITQFFSALGLYTAARAVGAELSAYGVFGGAFAYLPAIWFTAGIACALFAFAPKFTGFVWALLAYSFFACYFGKLFRLPEWLVYITPFGHIPQIPVEEFSAAPLIVLSAAAAALIAAGVAGFRRRDSVPG